MPQKKIKTKRIHKTNTNAIIALIVILIIAGIIIWAVMGGAFGGTQQSSPTPSPSPSPTATPIPTPVPQATTQEQVREDVMYYIRVYHNESNVEPYMQNLNWTGGRVTPENETGIITYTYISGGWNVTMQYSDSAQDPIYTVAVNYNSTSPIVKIDVNLTWQDGETTETDWYMFTPTPTP